MLSRTKVRDKSQDEGTQSRFGQKVDKHVPQNEWIQPKMWSPPARLQRWSVDWQTMRACSGNNGLRALNLDFCISGADETKWIDPHVPCAHGWKHSTWITCTWLSTSERTQYGKFFAPKQAAPGKTRLNSVWVGAVIKSHVAIIFSSFFAHRVLLPHWPRWWPPYCSDTFVPYDAARVQQLRTDWCQNWANWLHGNFLMRNQNFNCSN